MANADINLFYFYKRYLWTADNFTDWQTGMVDTARGLFEGIFKGAVMQGMGVTVDGSDLTAAVAAGIATGPTGNLLVSASEVDLSVPVPSTYPVRHLIVARPLITDNTYITNPTAPFELVPLEQTQGVEIILLAGIAASSPSYPSKGANDVVLAGLRVDPSTSALTNANLDLEVKDIEGKNSLFQENFGKYDDRLRPYVNSNSSVGIKPSQLSYPFPLAFSYVNQTSPSIFPRNSGGTAFNGGDTFLNMTTGAITGGDAFSSAFTPTIPTAGNWINAAIVISVADQLSVLYGTQGTRAQCYAGIINQTTAGAGSVPTIQGTQKPLAFVMVRSFDGTNITEVDVIDARGFSSIAAPVNGFVSVTTTYPVASNVDNVFADPTGAAFTVTLPSAVLNSGRVITVKNTGIGSTNNLTIASTAGNIEEGSTDTLAQGDVRAYKSDGANWWAWTT